MLGRVLAYPTKRPGRCFSYVRFFFIHQCVLEGFNTLRGDDSKSHLFVKAGDKAQRRDSRKPRKAFGVRNILHERLLSTSVGDDLRELRRLTGNLPHAVGGVLANQAILLLQTSQNPWENRSLNDRLRERGVPLGDLGKTGENLSFQLVVGMSDQASNKTDRATFNHLSGQPLTLLADFREATGSDTLEFDLGFLDT